VNLRTLILSSRRFTDEGWAELMTALRECPHLARLEMASCGLGPKHAGDLADILSDATQFTASVNKIALSGNALTGGSPDYNPQTDAYDIQTDGKDISGVSALFSSMTQVAELDVSNCGLGPTATAELAKVVSSAEASLTKVVITGAEISETDVATLRAAAPNGCEVVW